MNKFDTTTMDARDWAEEFMKLYNNNPNFTIDKGLMIGWFANVIMAGFDNAVKQKTDTTAEAYQKGLDEGREKMLTQWNVGYDVGFYDGFRTGSGGLLPVGKCAPKVTSDYEPLAVNLSANLSNCNYGVVVKPAEALEYANKIYANKGSNDITPISVNDINMIKNS